MSEVETLAARLDIELFVNCPNEECEELINLLSESDTDGFDHDDCGDLLNQLFPKYGSHDDFECDDVICTKCKTVFNVRGLDW